MGASENFQKPNWNNPIDKQYSRNLGIGDGLMVDTGDLPGDNKNSGDTILKRKGDIV